MFKVESYISPFILGYIDKYVKLKQEDFQLSLWGGDAVLNKLDLRLDVLEGALQLPITFKSGHIHELRLHVPWTKLGSEPVVITINTIECVLKLRDSAYNDSSSSKSGSAPQVQTTPPPKLKPIRPQDEEELPPGYLQSLMNRILHNVNIVVNNLILKFVEDDIVLSVNVKSAECYSVNREWGRAFVELAMPELVLRRVVDFHDLTICLDKRNASGKIETYQDPLLYRCSLTCRLHMIHDSLHSKLPNYTKFNVLCEKLDISLTDTQVPMFFRLVELCVAMYYGTLELAGPQGDEDDDDVGADAVLVQVPTSPGYDDASQQSWSSWAWSYVPAVLPSGEYEEDEEFPDNYVGVRRPPEPAVLAIGVYINKTSVVFKLSEYIKDSQYYSTPKVQFRPCMIWECEAIGIEVLLRAISFFNVQFGISGMKLVGLGEAICGVKDLEHGTRDPSFVRSGLLLDTTTQHPHYHLSQSLFDPGGAENLGDVPKYVFDRDEHIERYTELYALKKYGAFWLDYLFTMDEAEGDKKDKPNGSRSSNSNQSISDSQNVKESSTIRFLLGPTQLNVCSSMVQRIHKFIYCMQQHDYEPYSKAKPVVVEESAQPKDEEVTRLEDYIPTRSYHLTIVRPTICVMAADLPQYDVTRQKITSRKSKKSTMSKGQETTQPCQYLLLTLVLQADRFDLQVTSAMYPKALVQVVSKLPAPSSNLIHHCHSHMYIKIFGLQAGLTAIDPGRGMYPLQAILQPTSGVYYKRTLLLPAYWKNQLQPVLEHLYELPQMTISITKPQLLAIVHLIMSWQQTHPSPGHLHHLSLLDDVFKVRYTGAQPVLEVGMSGLEVKHCNTESVLAVTGTLTSLQAMVLCTESDGSPVTPILSGPVNTYKVYNMELFSKKDESRQEVEIKQDFVTFTLQIPKNPNLPQAPTTLLADVLGFAICWDPIIKDWINYTPVVRATIPMTKTNKDNDESAVVSNILLETMSQLKKDSETPSESTVTNPTDSQTRTQSLTQTSQPVMTKVQPATDSAANVDSTDEPVSKGMNAWGKMFSQLYPLIKMMHIQVEIKSPAIFLPVKHIHLSDPSVDIPANLRSASLSGTLPDTLVISLPSIKIHCSGHRTISSSQEIPIKAMEQSLAGVKLPWSVTFQDCSVYTVHTSSGALSMLDPASLSATIAVTTKYRSPLSNSLMSLGLCVHVDMEAITVKCSKPQLDLAVRLMVEHGGSVGKVNESIQMIYSLHQKGFKMADTTNAIPPSAPNAPPVLGLNSSSKKAGSSAQLEHGELGLATITETSESLSRGDASTQHEDDADVITLSLWIQWTLLKFVFKVFVDNDGQELLLRGELEDLTTAIDVQDVFSKLRCKVGTFTVQHFVKKHATWQPGSYKGLILSSMDHLSRNIPIATNQNWTNESEASNPMFRHEDPRLPDASLGFMTLTFTRALQKNVEKKLQQGNMADNYEAGHKKGSKQGYVNEICLNVQPCDVTLNSPVLAAFMDIACFQVMDARGTQSKTTHSEDKSTTEPMFTSSSLPLVYLNMGHLRLLVPNCVHSKDDSVCSGHSDQIQMTPESSIKNLSLPQHDMDMFVLQIAAISLKPHADNPLPRNVIDKGVYEQAVHAGITSQPGSEVEDRQYQTDIQGLSLSSGSWSELMSLSDSDTANTKDPNVQNPALEWNTLKTNADGEIEEMRLIPVASSFNLRVVAAPAIVYTTHNIHDTKPVLVCGYSLEVNATTEMDYYVSGQQIQLLHEIYTHNITSVLSSTSAKSPQQHDQPPFAFHQSDISMDSGVESEVSTLKSIKMKVKKTEHASAAKTTFDWSSVTPFEFLLTAGKISFMLYDIVDKQPEIQVIDIGSGSVGFHDMNTLSIPVIVPIMSADKTTSILPTSRRPSNHIKPFLYAYFSQPHSLISCNQVTQKAELSCFDIILKGAREDYVIEDVGRVIPEPVDYMVHWIETRPGRCDPKTGIPPSLYTLRINDMFNGPAKINLCIERPLKVNLSTRKLDQVLDFWNTLSTELFPVKTSNDKSVPRMMMSSPEPAHPEILTTLTWAGDLHLHMDQVLVVMETTLEKKLCGVQLSVTQIDSDVAFLQHEKDYIQEVSCTTSLKDLVVKTTYMSNSHPLVGPFTSHVTVGLQWLPHSGPTTVPQTLVFVECGLVQVNLGQEHVLCLEVMADSIKEFLGKICPAEGGSPSHSSPVADPRSKVIHRSTSDIDRSTDDLRTGDFEFVSDDMGVDLLPAVNEVVFGVDSEVGQATMTWCYPCPRVVTSIGVTPVPFTLPLQVEAAYVDENLRVPCVLQYWNVLSRKFDHYHELSLSENEHTDVCLPEITADFNRDLVISAVWRILILHPDGDKQTLGMDDLELEPLISPMILAASVRVDSAFVPSYIPMMQCSVMSSLVQLRLANHFTQLGQEAPSSLRPYHLDESNPRDHEYAVMSLEQPVLTVSYIHGKQNRSKLSLSGSVHCELLEYRSLSMQPLLEPAQVNIQVNWLQGKEWEKLQVDVMIDEIFLRISQGMVHTVSMAVLAWKQLKKPSCERIIPNYYVICNDTQQVIRFGQVDSDESIVLQSREAHPYSWRSHREKQMLQICTEGLGWHWSKPLCIDNEGVMTCTIETSDNTATLIIRIKQIANCQKQVTISGQVIIASRLTRLLDIRLLSTTVTTETTSTLAAMKTLPSYIMGHDEVRAVKVKLEGSKTAWSQEIPVTGDKVKDSRLIKLPLHDKKGYIHIWCHIFCQQHKRVSQNLNKVRQILVVLTPLFVVRTQLPNALLMNIDTPRLKQCHQVALDGRGLEQQLHTMGGDMTHNLTFQLSPMMKPSSPAITLSSGLIDQVQCETIDKPDINDLMYGWHDTDGSVWPYNTERTVSCRDLVEDGHQQDIIISQNYYPLSNHATTLPRGQNYPTHQPNIDLKINLSQLWAGCNTLLIDVIPYWLMDNQSGADLVLIGRERGCTEEKQWKVGQGQTFAPPVMEGPFKLGIMWGYMLHQSSPITLSDEDNRSRYLPNAPDLLYIHDSLCITIPLIKDGMVSKICYLTLHSVMQHGMRTLTTRERYCLANMTRWPLDCLCLSLTLSLNKIDILGETFSSHLIGCSGDNCKDTVQQPTNHELPLLLWDIPISESSMADFLQPSGKQTEHVQYMTFRQNESQNQDGRQAQYCHPVRLKVTDQGSRQTIALPCPPDGTPQSTQACTLTTQLSDNIIYVVLLEDKNPAILIHNNCHVPFHVGQTLAASGISGVEVQEEAELTTSLHTVPALGSYHYAFPSDNTLYPDVNKTQSPWKLHFSSTDIPRRSRTASSDDEKGAEVKVEEVKKVSYWSLGVGLESQHDTFVSVPNAVDIKVHVERVGHTHHIFIDPVSRAEISAKEIRSRIQGKEVVVIETSSHEKQPPSMGSDWSPKRLEPHSDHHRQHVESVTSESPQREARRHVIEEPGARRRVIEEPGARRHVIEEPGARRRVIEEPGARRHVIEEPGARRQPVVLETHASLMLLKLCVTIVDQRSDYRQVSELLRATASDLVIAMTPEDITKALTTRQTHFMQRIMCGVGNIQVDNQVYGKGNYDFPVLFVPQQWSESHDWSMSMNEFLKLPKFEKWKEIKKKSMVYATVQLCQDVLGGHSDMTRFSLASEPLTLHLEDVYIYDLIKYVDKLIPTTLVRNSHSRHTSPTRLPVGAYLLAYTMNSPIRFQRLSIEPVSLLVSVHASLKLFIASDNTPLRFGQFERTNVFTNSTQLIRTLAMHYASGALFRAGWVVGSLEILGSPTGLVRSIGNGIADMFRMPYEGFTRGPGAFVGGVTRGMGSLLKHVSTGTITSITNFASSLSRNMERLSLDVDHCDRQEEGRRHRPDGLSQGLKNGLTGLGLSLLGAVAGIADQPIQTLAQPTDEQRTTSQAATGIVSGVGKGLVGVVTKPIGGAAELVSQTGMGLLQGMGLSQFPQQRHQPVDEDIAIFPNGTVKYMQKMLQSTPKSEILFAAVASQMTTGKYSDVHQVSLLLTGEVLFIINDDQDVQQQAFTLTEIECVEEHWDPQVLRIIVKDGNKSADRSNCSQLSNTERVAEFIDKTAQYAPITSHDTEHDYQSDETKKNDDQSESRKHKDSSGQSELKKEPDGQSESPKRRSRKKRLPIGPFDFQVDSRHKEMFIAMFNIATDRVTGYGFPM